MNSNQNIAVLVFAQSAFSDGKQQHIKNGSSLFDQLTQRTLRQVQQSELTYFHFTEEHQIGRNFGERFVNAIQAVYDKGFHAVITVGNDSPQLKTSHILKAAEKLSTGKSVLGPSLDGGFYLMGLQKSQFDASLFLRLPWQRIGLFRKIAQLLKKDDATVYHLPIFRDLDSAKDINDFVSTLSAVDRGLLALLRNSLETVYEAITFFNERWLHHIFVRVCNKGSPLQLS